MNWSCCTPNGKCQRGHGCPAGVDLHQGDKAEHPECPIGHPGQAHGVARVGKQHPLRHVMLDTAKPRPSASALSVRRYIARRVLQLLCVAAVIAIWALATATADASGPCTDTRWQCTTNWENEA